jgi:hypothetical protein
VAAYGVGYQLTALELIHEQFGGPPPSATNSTPTPVDVEEQEKQEKLEKEGTTTTTNADADAGDANDMHMHVPVGPDLRENGGAFAAQAAAWGIEELPRMAEVYPLGGAGDRLGGTVQVVNPVYP